MNAYTLYLSLNNATNNMNWPEKNRIKMNVEWKLNSQRPQ